MNLKGRLVLLFIIQRAKWAWIWRAGLIKRTTAFTWEVAVTVFECKKYPAS